MASVLERLKTQVNNIRGMYEYWQWEEDGEIVAIIKDLMAASEQEQEEILKLTELYEKSREENSLLREKNRLLTENDKLQTESTRLLEKVNKELEKKAIFYLEKSEKLREERDSLKDLEKHMDEKITELEDDLEMEKARF